MWYAHSFCRLLFQEDSLWKTAWLVQFLCLGNSLLPLVTISHLQRLKQLLFTSSSWKVPKFYGRRAFSRESKLFLNGWTISCFERFMLVLFQVWNINFSMERSRNAWKQVRKLCYDCMWYGMFLFSLRQAMKHIHLVLWFSSYSFVTPVVIFQRKI